MDWPINASSVRFLETRRFRPEEVAKVFSLPRPVLERELANSSCQDSVSNCPALDSLESRSGS